MTTLIRDFSSITLPLPEKEILFRLGGRAGEPGMTENFRFAYEKYLRTAFATCRISGRYRIIGIREIRDDGILLETDDFLPGGKFASAIAGCRKLWCAAATAGRAVVEARDRQKSAAARAVFDAVASETADAAMDFLQRRASAELLRQNLGVAPMRYSPGYGDMPLEAQRLFFKYLDLHELDLNLNENFFISPEKSVTAWAGVSALGEKNV